VTHDQAEAMVLGDRIVVMRNGAIVQAGHPREIYFQPANRFVAEFIGSANIFEAQCREGMLELPGGRLKVENGAGGPVVAMIRPEALLIIPPERALLRGKVDTVSFVGDRQRVTVSGAAGIPMLIDAPNTRSIRIGETVGIEADPAAIRFVAEDARP
jgi:putative spermidine/putrescine transport system ATP-binding protein